MLIQWFLKGLPGVSDDAVSGIMEGEGLQSAWWRDKGEFTPNESCEVLTHRNLVRHVSHFDESDPQNGGRPTSQHTPFLSLSGGTVREVDGGKYYRRTPAIYTALRFATEQFRNPGWVVRGYVFLLGRPAVAQAAFAEEVRDLHQQSDWHNPFLPEGELAAKIQVPATSLQWARRYDPAKLVNSHPDEPLEYDAEVVGSYFVEPGLVVNLREEL